MIPYRGLIKPNLSASEKKPSQSNRYSFHVVDMSAGFAHLYYYNYIPVVKLVDSLIDMYFLIYYTLRTLISSPEKKIKRLSA